MAFYVPLGPKGVIFRFGTILIGVLGGVVYRLASLRRLRSTPEPVLSLLVLEGLATD